MQNKKIKESIEQLYGSSKNDYQLLTRTVLCGWVLYLLITVIMIFDFPNDIFLAYLRIVRFVGSANIISLYFLMKKKESDKHKKIIISISYALFVLLLVVTFLIYIINYIREIIVNKTGKIYIFDKYPDCLMLEIVIHILFFVVVLCILALYKDKLLLVTLLLLGLIVFSKFICFLVRKYFVGSKDSYYDKFCYKREVGEIQNEFFLFAYLMSLCFQEDVSVKPLFVPILVYYAFQNLIEYYRRKELKEYKIKYLISILDKIEEIKDIHLNVIENELSLYDYVDLSKVEIYRKYNVEDKEEHSSKREEYDFILSKLIVMANVQYNLQDDRLVLERSLEDLLNAIVKYVGLHI